MDSEVSFMRRFLVHLFVFSVMIFTGVVVGSMWDKGFSLAGLDRVILASLGLALFVSIPAALVASLFAHAKARKS